MAKQAKKSAKKIVESVGVLQNANIVHALSYLPFFVGAVSMYFLGKTDKKAAMHHIKYSVLMAVIVIIAYIPLDMFFDRLLSLAYVGVSAFFAYKAYMGEEVKVEIFDTIEDKISEKIKK